MSANGLWSMRSTKEIKYYEDEETTIESIGPHFIWLNVLGLGWACGKSEW